MQASSASSRNSPQGGCLDSGEYRFEGGWPDAPRCPDAGVPRSEQLISELLQPAGYRTGVVGKWHLGLAENLRPNQRGFDFYYGFLNGAHSFVRAEQEWGQNPEFWPIYRNNEPMH
jgi:arylsulfatase A-like enzyme